MRIMITVIGLLLQATFGSVINAADAAGNQLRAPAVPLPAAHAHNDYEHQRPLTDALDHGFCSVEVDIHLVDGKLLVAHDRSDVSPRRTLETVYLDPLLARVRAGDGRVYPGGPGFTLLIDIKSDGTATYRKLASVLAKYEEMLTTVHRREVKEKAVTVVISGNRDKKLIGSAEVRHAGIDGRLADLESDVPEHLMPLISDRWGSHFRWNGEGPFPDDERIKLQKIVDTAHRRGRRVRFWATPERIALWRELSAAGVDLINTDDLAGLERFLRGR